MPSCFSALPRSGVTKDLSRAVCHGAPRRLSHSIIGMARAGWNLDKLKDRARDSLQQSGDFDPASFDKLAALLRYVDGDYADPKLSPSSRVQ